MYFNENLCVLRVTDVTKCTRNGEAYMAILREEEGTRIMPVLMDQHTAHSLMLKMGNLAPPSAKLTMPDIMLSVFGTCHLRMLEVRICAVQGGVTYCHLLFEQEGMVRVVRNCRASEGLLLAYTFRCPIRIDNDLLERQYMRRTSADSYSMPVNSVSTEAIQTAMEQAIKEENYELASQLRDELERRK